MNKPKTVQENHIVRDPSYNIACLTRDVMDLRKKFVRCSIDKIAGIDSLVFGHSSTTVIRPPILDPQLRCHLNKNCSLVMASQSSCCVIQLIFSIEPSKTIFPDVLVTSRQQRNSIDPTNNSVLQC